MQNGIVLLHSPVVTQTDNRFVNDQRRANGNAAFTQTFFGLGDGGLQVQGIVVRHRKRQSLCGIGLQP